MILSNCRIIGEKCFYKNLQIEIIETFKVKLGDIIRTNEIIKTNSETNYAFSTILAGEYLHWIYIFALPSQVRTKKNTIYWFFLITGKDHVVLMTEEDAQVNPKYQLPPTANDEPAGK